MPRDLYMKDSLSLIDINFIEHHPSQIALSTEEIHFLKQEIWDFFELLEGVLWCIKTLPLSSWVRVFTLNGLPLISPSEQTRLNKGK